MIDRRLQLIGQFPSAELVVFTYQNTVDPSILRSFLFNTNIRMTIEKGALVGPSIGNLGFSTEEFPEDILVAVI